MTSLIQSPIFPSFFLQPFKYGIWCTNWKRSFTPNSENVKRHSRNRRMCGTLRCYMAGKVFI